jgi:KaiC/GvpD/RAD55 family RecA-like ATPase
MDIKKIINEARFIDRDLPDEIPTITIQGKTVATKGNFITINGMPKSYKTTIMNFFIYSAISNTEIHGISLNTVPGEEIVLIDTEQGAFDLNRQIKRLKRILEVNSLPTCFSVYSFRQNEPHEILRAIETIIVEQKPKYLFIDNLTELVLNPNDMLEAKTIIQFLKRITALYDTTIICLLHLGKTSFNSLGNLGSYADRATQTAIKLKYDTDQEVIYIEPYLMRSDRLFKTIGLKYSAEDQNFDTVNVEPKEKRRAFDIATQNFDGLKSTINVIFDTVTEVSYSELVEELKPLFGVGLNTIKQKIIPHLLRINLLKKTDGYYKMTN